MQRRKDGPLWLSAAEQPLAPGMSGLPILDEAGAAIGVFCMSQGLKQREGGSRLSRPISRRASCGRSPPRGSAKTSRPSDFGWTLTGNRLPRRADSGGRRPVASDFLHIVHFLRGGLGFSPWVPGLTN